MREELTKIRIELRDHFADVQDLFSKQMWQFISRAKEKVDDLIQDINNADATFVDVINYFGEDDKTMTSSEFYGIFKTFITSYKVCGGFEDQNVY